MKNEIVPLTVIDLDGDPRVRDTDLAERLGFERPRVIRELIQRNIEEIEGFGRAPCRTALVEQAMPRGGMKAVEVHEYWLNEEQALLVSILSKAPNAPAVRAMLIRVFVAWRRGNIDKPKPVLPKRRTIRSRDDLSFTRRDADGCLQNFVTPVSNGQWDRHFATGEEWFSEIEELALHNATEAQNAIKFAGMALLPIFGRGTESNGFAAGFFDKLARATVAGILQGAPALR